MRACPARWPKRGCTCRYDPNPQVQESMAGILLVLVPERAKALTEHCGAVLKDLLSEMGARLWRNRQAACLAAADLLQVRCFRNAGA